MKIKERILLAVITHIVLFGNGCIAQKIAKGTNTSFKFDFGSGKTALGYTAVRAASIYSDETGFGFEKAGLLQTTGKPEKINVTGETGQINILLPRQGVSLLKMNWYEFPLLRCK